MTERPRCPRRCWFTIYGFVGLRAPYCQRCGRANPRRLNKRELDDYDYFVQHSAYRWPA